MTTLGKQWVVLCPDGQLRPINKGGIADGSWNVPGAANLLAQSCNTNPTCCKLPGAHVVRERSERLLWPPRPRSASR